MRGHEYDIGDFGASGDGKTKNTAAIQAAIDKCFADGGGKVVVPPGEYVTGTVFIKDNVELCLANGALLKGSPDLADYNKDDCFEQNAVFTSENVTGAHMIIAHEARNVSISGPGTIDGNSRAFASACFGQVKDGEFRVSGKRPGQMIYFCECVNVRVTDVRLDNAPYWTCFIHGCENVCVRGVRIENPRKTKNGDGIDVDCCRNVTISDCVIYSGDDCITLRAWNDTLKDKSRACENVAVSNCVLSTPCNALRIGVGDGIVQNCVLSNIVVRNTRNGICLISKYSESQKAGATIQNIRFSNFVMETIMPFYIALGFDASAPVENIGFAHFRTTASQTSCLYGNGRARLENIRFRDVEIEVTGGKDFVGDRAIDPCVHREWEGGADSAFFIAKTRDVSFKDLRMTWKNIDAPWRHCFKVLDNEGLEIESEKLSSPFAQDKNEMIQAL